MGKTKNVRQAIIGQLGQSPMGKSELKKVIKAKDPSWKKLVKKSLKELVSQGEIVKEGKLYKISAVQLETVTGDDLPIAVRMRKEQDKELSVRFEEPQVDIDDEIRRLEAELQGNSSSEESELEDDDDGQGDFGVVSLSAYANDHTDHLSGAQLPTPGKYSARGPSEPLPRKSKSEKAKELEQRRVAQKKADGLKEAVKEVLDGYKARSSERLPFYCRFCSQQYNNEEEFFAHKQTEFHQTAVEMERKATYCRLCTKQLTSPAQMREHLASKPHKEKLQFMRSRQRADGRRTRKERGDRNGRQWV
eukprot:Nitzschia sp. Nitz4//scaffold55_size114948//86389//87303//NITZ4_003916-RA/size114948-processed-gene-0.78-mRNA-1//-1//CDS//3329554575//8435//frame0